MDLLSSVNSPEDIKKLDIDSLEKLCSEIRACLIENVANTGGHLASNLGIVELTLALHRVFNSPQDKIVFDVGHQCYVHKLITGRRDKFPTLRSFGGLSGFPKPNESEHDSFIAGHASNSISVALGMARARTLEKKDSSVVAIIGDGALTGGLAYEGLTNAGASKEPMIVVLNDNGMSIDSNVGSISEFLSELRLRPSYFEFKRRYRSLFKKCPKLYAFNHRIKEWFKRRLLPGNIFGDLGFEYLGPVDGHNISQLEAVLTWAKELNCPVIVHVITQKGRGYALAEEDPESYHGVNNFDSEKGVDKSPHKCFSGAFGNALSNFADDDDKIVAITAAMTSGTGLSGFAEKYPKRFFDVGIAEGHAVAMAAGMAKEGLKPVFAVYSTFLQRSYDMLIHDIALQHLHVVLAVDRAGIVGSDGETHQGSFDVSYLCTVPGMAVLCPSSYQELHDMLQLALYKINGPVAVRFSRGQEGQYTKSAGMEIVSLLSEGTDVTLVSYGIMINEVLAAAAQLSREGISAEVIKLNLINPLDEKTVLNSLRKTRRLVVAEDACAHGSIGSRLLAAVAKEKLVLKGEKLLDLGSGILPHGSVTELLKLKGLDSEGIVRSVRELMLSGVSSAEEIHPNEGKPTGKEKAEK